MCIFLMLFFCPPLFLLRGRFFLLDRHPPPLSDFPRADSCTPSTRYLAENPVLLSDSGPLGKVTVKFLPTMPSTLRPSFAHGWFAFVRFPQVTRPVVPLVPFAPGLRNEGYRPCVIRAAISSVLSPTIPPAVLLP